MTKTQPDQPQPKTQAELQARVLEVLRREWPDTYIDQDDDYYWKRGSDDVKGHMSRAGVVFGVYQGDPNARFGSAELDVLAEASRLLRDGVAKPSRVDRALEVLRVEFPDAKVCESAVLGCYRVELTTGIKILYTTHNG